MPHPGSEQRVLERFMQLSIAAAVATIALKALAAWFTGSVGFLSDALESVVNLVAAVACFLRCVLLPSRPMITTNLATVRPSTFLPW